PIGGDMSHEFIILAETGESEVFCHQELLDYDILGENVDFQSAANIQGYVDRWTSLYAATDEMHDADRFAKEVPEDKQVSARGIEVGHIFFFGDKYSKPLGAVVTTSEGVDVPVQMGSYGVGVSRLVGGVIEACHDDEGIVWPDAVAPFKVGLINLRAGDDACDRACDDIFAKLGSNGTEVLYDDRDERAGVKVSEMDLIGLPWQLIVGPRGLKNGVVEVKNRKTGEREELSVDAALNRIAG
ncbi:MAG: His/Gly/Thr/Pro-type tRNA ligase C-terminal domain-containing protein, partial [Rickettsiales bacterium]